MATVTEYASGASGTSWTTPTNANADDAAYATYTIAVKSTTGNVNTLTNFGFDTSIAAGSTITSVALEVEHKVSTAGGIAFLECAVAISGTPGTFNSDSTEPTTDTAVTYATLARPGGGTWTRDDLLDGTFTVQLRARSGNNATSVVYSWDYARVVVVYERANHAATGTLTGPGSTVAGTAARTRAHATTGTLTGPGSTVDGTAARTAAPVSHATSGALTGQGSTVAGTAARTRAHATSGVLAGQGSTVVGSAARSAGAVTHATSGALTGQGSTVTGTAARFRAFDTAGVLVGGGSVVVGSAVHQSLHTTSGALTGQGSTLSGSASRFRAHATDGILIGPGSTVVGSADHSTFVTHDSSGVLVGAGAAVSGTAAKVPNHQTSGALVGAGAAIVGTAVHNVTHATSGVLVGQGSTITGAASRTRVHEVTGALVGAGSTLTGAVTRVGAVLLSAEHVVMLADIWQRFGLDATAPLTETTTAATFGGITLSKSGTDTLTSTRSGGSVLGDPAVMIPDLYLRLGLDEANPMTASATSVVAGTLTQTIVTVANGVLVTRI